jgi:flagellar hook-associated protein 1 FlgK
MASSFMGLYVQREAILLAQKALDITGNNISNINTPGYTRQRLDICSVANKKGTLGYNTGVSLAGRGSEAIGVAQIRDRLVDRKVRVYSGDLCKVGIKLETLSDVEDVFDSIEADDLGASFASIVSQFKAALQGFSADNADRTELANVAKNTADSLVKCILTYNSKLNDISEQTFGDADKTVDRINEIFMEMGNLNKQIKESYISMGYITPTMTNYEVMSDYGPLELKDSMNSLLDELSQYGNIDVKEEPDGTFTVKFADQTVVEGKKFAQMAITKESPIPTELEFEITETLLDSGDWYDLHMENKTGGSAALLIRGGNAGDTVNITGKKPDGSYYLDSGSLRGYLDVYNGRGAFAHDEVHTGADVVPDADISNQEKGIEYYRDMLNSFVKTATEQFNAVFKDFAEKEVDANGNEILDADGNPVYKDTIFTFKNKDGVSDFRTAAENFRVADTWNDNPEFISNPTGDNEFEELDNVYINKMLGVLTVEHQYGDGVITNPSNEKIALEKFVTEICDDLGVNLSTLKSLYNATDISLTAEETARSEIMDVSMDEEGVNMMNYRKWYNAISRMITTMDEALEKLINGTGVVGLR